MDQSILVAGARVRYQRAGSGPVLVLLYGGGLDSARPTWSPVWQQLTAVADVLAPDLPGFGGSELGATTPTLEGYRSWLVGFLDACGIQRVVLGGLSLGGGIKLRTALDRPDRVAGLVLCAPYGVDPKLPGGRLGWGTVQLPGLDRLTWTALRHSRWMVRRTPGHAAASARDAERDPGRGGHGTGQAAGRRRGLALLPAPRGPLERPHIHARDHRGGQARTRTCGWACERITA